MTKFEEIKKDVKELILSEISYYTDRSKEISIGVIEKRIIQDCEDRLNNLDETTVKYIMRLTNDYIRAKKKNIQRDIDCDLTVFRKYGFDAQVLDREIAKIEFEYNADNDIWPSKHQERILQIVYSFFECPGKLPSVDTVLDIASKFGAMYGSNNHKYTSELRWLDTSHFDDPYDTCNYFSTALQNGLSTEDIIELTRLINIYLDYYSAPKSMGYFDRPKISSIVPHLEQDHNRISDIRAEKIYSIRKK